ncbi:MAG TPA: DsbE family thiol:disulfide interchange protein [Sedimenticola thiotaurini]|uniref:DsbE family thiol:disulfide interchange protein n=1 Tax=Sedimenticola thiotaurini TaxID=1543721 RepID=A0A831W537_9GAMM|nr:DsbE family thiol:disulfide interchange protein [Sedimenticola thiotaurini]
MKARYLIPLGIFLALVILLGVGLTLDPREVPSPFIGKPAPEFRLPRLNQPDQTIGPGDMKGQVWLLNVWASWCVSCRAEHKVVNALAKTGEVTVVGLNYKDEPDDARSWLAALGNPYLASAMDREGRVGIDWGVYGVPETFVIDRQGIIRYKHIGPITQASLQEKILPLVRRLKGES